MKRALLIAETLSGFEFFCRRGIDATYAAEAEDRIDGYARGELAASSVKEVDIYLSTPFTDLKFKIQAKAR